MAKYSVAQAQSVKRYLEKNNLVEVKFRTEKSKKEIIKAHAENNGESLNGFINRAVKEAIERDTNKKEVM